MNTKISCCCGVNSFEIAGEIKLNVLCHCTDCKKRTGSAFGHSLYFPKTAIKKAAKSISKYSLDTEAGKQERYFCSQCGSTIYWYWDRFEDWVGVAGGCLSGNTPEPSISTCHDQKRDWLEIPETWRVY